MEIDFDDDMFNQEIDVDFKAQCADLQSRCIEYAAHCKILNQNIADLVHENRTLKNNIDSYSIRHGVKFHDSDRYQWLRMNTAWHRVYFNGMLPEEWDKMIDDLMQGDEK